MNKVLTSIPTVPLYQSETSPKWIRGTIVGSYQLAITIGLFLASIVNNATKNRNDTGSYRIPVAVQFAWAIIIIVGMLILPETPRYLIKKDQHEKVGKSGILTHFHLHPPSLNFPPERLIISQASIALARIRRLEPTHPAVVEELAEIDANFRYEQSIGKKSFFAIFRGTVGKRLFTGASLQALQQLSGVNFIFYYGTAYFQRAGFENPFVIQVITNSVNVASTLPGLYLVEKMGRRNLLLMGAIGMCISQFIVAITGTVAGTTDVAAQRAAIAFVCIYIVSLPSLSSIPMLTKACSSSLPVPGVRLLGWSRENFSP